MILNGSTCLLHHLLKTEVLPEAEHRISFFFYDNFNLDVINHGNINTISWLSTKNTVLHTQKWWIRCDLVPTWRHGGTGTTYGVWAPIGMLPKARPRIVPTLVSRCRGIALRQMPAVFLEFLCRGSCSWRWDRDDLLFEETNTSNFYEVGKNCHDHCLSGKHIYFPHLITALLATTDLRRPDLI